MSASPKELPNSWQMTLLGDVTTKSQYGWTTKATSSGENLKLLRTSDISSGRVNWNTVPTCVVEPKEPEKYFLNAGDIVVSRAGSVGKSFLIREDVRDAVFASYLVRFTPRISPEYIHFFMQSRQYWEQIEDKSAGIAIPNVNASKLSQLKIPLAPFNEQLRIVEKIETLFARLDKGEEALRRLQILLKRYRQSVLKAAVTGELTADWRAENSVKIEHGRDLLARILKARRETWTGRGRYKEPVPTDTSGMPEVPEGWVWTSLESLADHIPNSIVDGPFGSNLKTSHYQDDGVRVIRLGNIGDGFFVDKKSFISEDHAETLSRHSIYAGDIVIASLGEELPRACIVPESLTRAIVKADCIRFSPYRESVNANYVLSWLNSRILRGLVGEKIRGVGRPRLNLSDIRSFAVPLPSKAEQDQIAEIVADVDDKIDKMKVWCEVELARSASLRQSILKEAFAGRLVEQDPNDEAASELLARIKGEQPIVKKTKNTQRKTTA